MLCSEWQTFLIETALVHLDHPPACVTAVHIVPFNRKLSSQMNTILQHPAFLPKEQR